VRRAAHRLEVIEQDQT